MNVNEAPQPGELWRLQPDQRSSHQHNKLVLVVKGSRTGWAQITPIHTFDEFALYNDIVVPPKVSGLSYKIVIPTNFRSAVPTSALTQKIIALPDFVVNAYWSPKNADITLSKGFPSIGVFDARHEFKRAELQELVEITHIYLDELTE
jgi:hypothetical protein